MKPSLGFYLTGHVKEKERSTTNCGGRNLLRGIHPFGEFIETKVWHTTLNNMRDQKLLMY
jgi:hypothetical protein